MQIIQMWKDEGSMGVHCVARRPAGLKSLRTVKDPFHSRLFGRIRVVLRPQFPAVTTLEGKDKAVPAFNGEPRHEGAWGMKT
jgi:hypothetical protein